MKITVPILLFISIHSIIRTFYTKIVTSQTYNEIVGNSLKYLEKSINEFKEVEELLKRFEDTTLNEGNLTELLSCKNWDMFCGKKLKKYTTSYASVSEDNTVDANVYFIPVYFKWLLKYIPYSSMELYFRGASLPKNDFKKMKIRKNDQC